MVYSHASTVDSSDHFKVTILFQKIESTQTIVNMTLEFPNKETRNQVFTFGAVEGGNEL